MAQQANQADAEFEAMRTVYQSLEALEDDARSRVLKYVVDRLQVVDLATAPRRLDATTGMSEDEEAIAEEEAEAPKYNSLADLADATQPKTNADKALVAGYWLQVCSGAESFDGFSANKELKNLGQGVPNITMAIDTLRNQKPALALQLKKSGKSRQARKTYKLTIAGIKAVEGMIARNS
jgi:hypothetical protein